MDANLITSYASSTDNKRCKPVFALIDMDCFYVQVEQRFCPETKGKPCAVVQYKTWRGGGIIAVSYEARALGVNRLFTGNEAQEVCPSIHLFRVPEKRGKADLTRYRESSQEVMDILLSYVSKLERASVDEAFVDITELVEQRMKELTASDCFSMLKGSTMVAHYDPTPSAATTASVPDKEDVVVGKDSVSGGKDTPSGVERHAAHLPDDNCKRSERSQGGGISVDCDNIDHEVRVTPDMLVREDLKEQDSDEEGGAEDDILEAGNDVDNDEDDDVPALLLASSQQRKDELLRAWLDREAGDFPLAVGAVIVMEMRNAVYEKLGFTCSAGIAYNKVLAKLAAGMNKPNGQTVLPPSSVDGVFDVTPIKKVRNLGGKFGMYVQEDLQVQFMGEVRRFSAQELTSRYGEKSGTWLYNLCRGCDDEPLRLRYLPKSISCGKNFYGTEMLTSSQKIQMWLQKFSEEVLERMEVDKKHNNRQPTLFSVYFTNSSGDSFSRSGPVGQLSADKLAGAAWQALGRASAHSSKEPVVWSSGVVTLGLSLSKFEGVSPKKYGSTLHSFFVRKPDAAKRINDQSAELGEEASHSDTEMQCASSIDVKAVKCNDTPTRLPSVRHVTAGNREASSDLAIESPIKLGGSSNLQQGCGGDAPISASGMPTKQEACLHSQFRSEVESCIDVMPGGDVSKLLDAAGMNQGIFCSLPSDIQREIIHDLSISTSNSAHDEGVSSCSTPRPCEVCGIPIPRSEAQMHSDYHMAQQLSVSLRDGGRSQAAGVRSEETADCTSSANTRKRSSYNQCNSLNKYFKPSKR